MYLKRNAAMWVPANAARFTPAELWGSDWDGDDVVGVGPWLRPWAVHVRPRPSARYAAAEIYR